MGKLGALALLAPLAVSGCDATLVASAKSRVRDILIDPQSAVFEKVRVVEHPHGRLVCGEVNAKNRMGGYVGRQLFVYVVDVNRAVIAKDQDGKMVYAVSTVCAGGGGKAPHLVLLEAST